MKRIATFLLCAATVMTLLCGCSEADPQITTITREDAPNKPTTTVTTAEAADPTTTTTTTTTVSTTTTTTTTTADVKVWISQSSEHYHCSEDCGDMVAPTRTSESRAIAQGLTPCEICYAPITTPPTVTTVPTTRPSVADGETSAGGAAIAELAVSLIGSPYTKGGTGPDAFDNPGFITYCYKQSGHTVSRTLSAVLNFGVEAPLDALQAGDILLFCEDESGKPTFAAIYIGGNRFVACKNPTSGTVEQALNNTYWLPRLIAARRAG